METELTSDSLASFTDNWANEIMGAINTGAIHDSNLAAQIALMTGFARGAALRIEYLERVAVAAKRLRDYERTPATPPDVIDDAREALDDALKNR